MATSGSTDYNINRDAIIRQALLHLRKVDPALTIGAQDISDGAIGANLMLKAWALDGVKMWLNEEVVLHLQYNTQFYALGPSGDNCCLLSDAKKTQLASAAASGAGTITVDSDDDIAASDAIGVELDGGTIQWTTVNGAPASDVVTLTAALTGAAAADNYVFTYTNLIARPVQVLEARVRDTDDVDIPIYVHSSRNEFMQITDKTSTGRTLEVFYNPDITNGQLYTWPIAGASDITDRLVMTVQRVIEDLDAAANNADAPVECLESIIWNLSVRQAPQYGVDLTTGKGITIASQAAFWYGKMKDFYGSREPFQLTPR